MLHWSICDGELMPLGTLGNVTHLRCRNCGSQASIVTTYMIDEEPGEPMAEASCYTCDRQLTEQEHGLGDGNCLACFEE